MSAETEIAIIAAIGYDRELGKDNTLLWHMPADLKYFKKMTMGCPMIMGRKTYDSIGRPLPGRRTLVVTRNIDFSATGTEVYHSLEAALETCKNIPRVFVAGGAEIYRLAMPLARVMFLTHVHGNFDADTYFPAFSAGWTCVHKEPYPADEQHAFAFTHCEYRRV